MSLQEILIEQIQDLYDAEKQLTKALPRMARAAKHPELKTAFEQHLRVTEEQVRRIERVFEELGEKAKSKPCAAMKGLVEEAREIISDNSGGGLMDAALIGAAQKVEHYEISGYGTARAIAAALKQKQAAELLKQTEMEEAQTDKLLTKVALNLYKEVGAQGLEEGDTSAGRGRSASSGRSSGRSASSRSGGSRSASQRGSSRSASQSGSRSSQSGTSGKSGRGTSSSAGRSRSASSRSSSRNGGSRSSGRSAAAHALTDHEQIRQWAEERGANPACVRGTGGKGDTGMIRLDFPGYSGAQSLQKIDWDEWFEKFDQNNLALLVQESTARGQKSNFNKLVSRETAASAGKGRR